MNKMAKRRRKAKKKKPTLSKLAESLKKAQTQRRVPSPPVGSAFKSKKDYNRQESKKIAKKAKYDV